MKKNREREREFSKVHGLMMFIENICVTRVNSP